MVVGACTYEVQVSFSHYGSFLQTRSYCDFICIDVWDSKGNPCTRYDFFFLSVLTPFKLLLFLYYFRIKRHVPFIYFSGCMCPKSHGKRWQLKESIQGLDFGWCIDCIRTSCSYLYTAKYSTADFLQESWFTHILDSKPNKNTFHCFFYIRDLEVCPRMASLSILLAVVLVGMVSLSVVPMSTKPFMDYY